MNKTIEKIKGFRHYLLNQIEDLTTQQLNAIPAGYNNSIIWNLGHLICATQNVCYVRAGLPIAVDDQYFSPYMPGTKPVGLADEATISNIKTVFITSIDALQKDVEEHKFKNYSPSIMIPKVYGFEVTTIDDALEYLLYHEGYHTGCILSLKHLL